MAVHRREGSKTARVRARVAIACLVALHSIAPGEALAHGDTIRVAFSGVRPERLVVVAGTTVHFHNANASGSPVTVVIGEGESRVESPVLGRAEGWHHTFDTPGEYRFHVKEYPSREGVVVVAPAPDSDDGSS